MGARACHPWVVTPSEHGSPKTQSGVQVSSAQQSLHPDNSGWDEGPGGPLCLPSWLTTKPHSGQKFGTNTQRDSVGDNLQAQTGRTDGQVATERWGKGRHRVGS